MNWLTWLLVAAWGTAIVAAICALIIAAARQPHGTNYHPSIDARALARRARQLEDELDRARLRDALNARPLPRVEAFTTEPPNPN